MELGFLEVTAKEVVSDLLREPSNTSLANRLAVHVGTPEGMKRAAGVVIATSRLTLLAKTAVPAEEQRFEALLSDHIARFDLSGDFAPLVCAIIKADLDTADDVFRDTKVISNFLFSQRLNKILRLLPN